MDILSRFRLLWILPTACITLVGCAGIKGAPDSFRVTKDAISEYDCYLKPRALIDTARCSQSSDRQFRDKVIDARIEVTDMQFRDFVNELTFQGTSFNLFSDFALLGLGAAGALASGGTTNILAAASAGVTGARGAVDKDIYYRATLPSVISTMRANRKEVLADIQTKKQLDEHAYTLGDALKDLNRYEEASTLNAALGTITAKADATATEADNVMQAMFTARLVEPDVQKRRVALSNHIRKLEAENDKDKLDKIAEVLGATIGSDIKEEAKDVRAKISTKILTKDDMDKISKTLHEKQITEEDF